MATMLNYPYAAEGINDRKSKKQMSKRRHVEWEFLYQDLLNIRLTVYNTFSKPQAKEILESFRLNEFVIKLTNGSRSDELFDLVTKEVMTVKELCVVESEIIIDKE